MSSGSIPFSLLTTLSKLSLGQRLMIRIDCDDDDDDDDDDDKYLYRWRAIREISCYFYLP